MEYIDQGPEAQANKYAFKVRSTYYTQSSVNIEAAKFSISASVWIVLMIYSSSLPFCQIPLPCEDLHPHKFTPGLYLIMFGFSVIGDKRTESMLPILCMLLLFTLGMGHLQLAVVMESLISGMAQTKNAFSRLTSKAIDE
jgi:hypothetical protein